MSDKDKEMNSKIDEEEEERVEAQAPTTGLSSNVVDTGKTRVRITVKLPMLRNFDEEVAHDVKNAGNKVPMQQQEEEEDDHNEQGSSDVASAEAQVSEVGELKEKADEGCGSSNSKNISIKDTSPEIYACPECSKTFRSCKALYGHMRLHRNRGQRGANKPAQTNRSLKQPATSSPPVLGWGGRAMRGRTMEQEEAAAAAETLVMISQAHPMTLIPNNVEEEEDINGEPLHDRVGAHRGAASAGKTYPCSFCNKIFITHQALGGHMAGHNKHKSNANAEAAEGAAERAARPPAAEHRCGTCNETFPTGQALGGHMRRHYNNSPPPVAASAKEDVQDENHAVAAAQEEVEIENHAQINAGNGNQEDVQIENHAPPENAGDGKRTVILFDLNELPPEEVEDSDAV